MPEEGAFFPAGAPGTVGILEKSWSVRFFCESVIPPVEVSFLREGSYFIENGGCAPLCAVLECSADACSWARGGELRVPFGCAGVLVAKYYGKYYRLHLFCTGPGTAEIRFIAQVYRSGNTPAPGENM